MRPPRKMAVSVKLKVNLDVEVRPDDLRVIADLLKEHLRRGAEMLGAAKDGKARAPKRRGGKLYV